MQPSCLLPISQQRNQKSIELLRKKALVVAKAWVSHYSVSFIIIRTKNPKGLSPEAHSLNLESTWGRVERYGRIRIGFLSRTWDSALSRLNVSQSVRLMSIIMEKKQSVGRKLGNMHYVHRSAIQYLNIEEQEALSHATEIFYSNKTETYYWNLVKISKQLDKVSLLRYQDFELNLFPCLEYAVIIDIAKKTVKEINYGTRENPPILHRQELMLAPDDPRVEKLSEVTKFCEFHDLFENSSYIGTRNKWYQRLDDRGYVVDGFTVYKIGDP